MNMKTLNLHSESTLTERYQTTVPADVRKALNLDKSDKLHYTIQSNGNVVLSRGGDDPAIASFLSFLASDMETNPQRLVPLGTDLLDTIKALVPDNDINLDEPLPEVDE
jgi:antitoxin PrlF